MTGDLAYIVERGSDRFQYRKRYEVTCDFLEDEPQTMKDVEFQYRKRYEVTCDLQGIGKCLVRHGVFQYRKRYEVTCDSVSGRPQKQKAQIKALENLLKTERMIALFGCHYIPREYVMTPPSLM